MEGGQTHPKLGRWTCIKTLGKGFSSEVKLGSDPLTGEKAAIKIIKASTGKAMKANIDTEVIILKRLNHPNIIKLIEYHEEIDYYIDPGRIQKVTAIVLEYASGGELYSYLASMSRLDHEIARTYFHQLVNAIEYCHNKGIVHRDLKPENLLLDANLNLKIADFGFSSTIAGPKNDGKLKDFLGTKGYSAPEIILKKPYSGPMADLFACGVILFNMISSRDPFGEAKHKDDKVYTLICKKDFKAFWDFQERLKITPLKNYYSEDFRDLIINMLMFDPLERISLNEVKAYPWFIGKTRSIDECAVEVKQKKESLEILLTKKKQEKPLSSGDNKLEMNYNSRGADHNDVVITDKSSILLLDKFQKRAFVDLEQSPTNKFDLRRPRPLKKYEGELTHPSICQFFSVIEANMLFKRFIALFTNTFNEYTVSPKSYKIEGRMITEDKDVVVIVLKIKKFDDELNIIELSRKEGSLLVFYDAIRNHLKERIEYVCSANAH